MQQNRKVSIDLLLKESPGLDVEAASRLWVAITADSLPLGLDYFALDTAAACGAVAVNKWLLDIRDPRATGQELIVQLESCRRRRYKMEKDWPDRREALVNRVNRAKRRAISMAIGCYDLV